MINQENVKNLHMEVAREIRTISRQKKNAIADVVSVSFLLFQGITDYLKYEWAGPFFDYSVKVKCDIFSDLWHVFKNLRM